jgi:hypothetical protein
MQRFVVHGSRFAALRNYIAWQVGFEAGSCEFEGGVTVDKRGLARPERWRIGELE